MRGLTAAVLALLAGCAGERRQDVPRQPKAPVEARASVDRATATTGDLITYRVTVDRERDVEVELGEPGAEIGGIQVVDLGREPARAVGDRVLEERWYELRADLVGSYVLPSPTVRFRRSDEAEGGVASQASAGAWQAVEIPAVLVEVESVLPAGGEARDIRDIKPLRRAPAVFPWIPVLTALAFLLVAAAIAWWLVRRHRRAVAERPAEPPHVAALRALGALRGTDFDDRVAVRRFYFALSEVIRDYVEGGFELNASDLTTEEILERLPFLTAIPDEVRSRLAGLLMESDRVKFAGHHPERSGSEAALERALAFVEATRPAEGPLEEAA